jgi:hypothetical protein
MKRTGGKGVREVAMWIVPVFLIAVLAMMVSESLAAQRSRSNRSAANPKVRVGEFAPDFELPRLTFKTDAAGKTVGVISDDDTIRLSDFRSKKPVCMIMSSYT